MKIVIALKDLEVGGIQRSCINFVNFLVNADIEVDLLLMNDDSPLLKELDNRVKIIRTNKSMFPFAVLQKNAKRYGFWFYINRTLIACIAKTLGNKYFLKRALKKQPKLDGMYDVAISFQPSKGVKSMMVGCSELILEKVDAKSKFAFMHSDFERSGLNEPYAVSIFEKFDKILCVSESCANQMKKSLTGIADKIDYLYNVINIEDVKKKADEHIEFNRGEFNLVTVARLGEEKGHLRLLEQLKKLIDEGFNFKYTIVGDGKEKETLENYIKSNSMEEYVELVGNKINPYPYMKKSDLFVLPSYHESYGMVLVESMILKVPVLSTETISAKEVVGDMGFVCENSSEGLYSELKSILSDKSKIEKARKNLSDYNYSLESIEKKLYELTKSI